MYWLLCLKSCKLFLFLGTVATCVKRAPDKLARLRPAAPASLMNAITPSTACGVVWCGVVWSVFYCVYVKCLRGLPWLCCNTKERQTVSHQQPCARHSVGGVASSHATKRRVCEHGDMLLLLPQARTRSFKRVGACAASLSLAHTKPSLRVGPEGMEGRGAPAGPSQAGGQEASPLLPTHLRLLLACRASLRSALRSQS